MVTGCDPAKAYMALLSARDGVNEEDMDPWAVVVDAPYAAYLEFGTMPTSKSRGRNTDGRSEVMDRFVAWALAKGASAQAGRAMYEYAMRKGILPNPYLRPAMYSVIEDLEAGVWKGAVTPRSVSEEIAERAKCIVIDDHMGAGDVVEGRHLHDSIRAELSNRSDIPLHPNADVAFFWTESGQWSGVGGKTARIKPRTR